MTLARTALRLQAIEALNAEPVLAALVQGRIFDSRIGNFDHREPVPVMIVTTEETKGQGYSANNGGEPFNYSCDLVIEIAMNVVVGNTAEPELHYVATDRELEAYLDLIEGVAIEALTVGESPAARLLRQTVTRRVPSLTSQRFATDQTGEKLAIRLLTLAVQLKGEDQGDATVSPTGPFASLPEPLRSVALAAPPGSSAHETCVGLAALLHVPAINRFAGADVTTAPHSLTPGVVPVEAADVAAGRAYGQTIDLPNWTAP